MLTTKISSIVATSSLLLTWTFVAAAQQQPGTNMPTPPPAPATVTAPTTTRALEEPVIDSTTERTSLPNTPLLVTGLVVLGGSYGASAIGAAISDRDSDDKLYYPVVGPWMALSDRDCSADPCGHKALGTTLLIGSGVLQGLGALSMALSLVVPRTTTHEWYLIGNDDLVVAPMLGSSQMGVGAVGRF
jgi:hypothetical protein